MALIGTIDWTKDGSWVGTKTVNFCLVSIEHVRISLIVYKVAVKKKKKTIV